MPSTYMGVPSTARLITPATITGAAGSPIVITTAAPHGFQTGDRVVVNGVGGNTNANSPANAPWTITVLTSTTFALNNVLSNASYTSGGAAYDVSFNPAMLIPSDNDTFNAAAFNVAYESLADRTAALERILTPYGAAPSPGARGGGQLIASYYGGQVDDTWSVSSGIPDPWSSGVANTAGWGTIVDWSPIVQAGAAPYPRVNYGDILEAWFSAGEVAVTSHPAPFGIGFTLSGVTSRPSALSITPNAKRVGAGVTVPCDLHAVVRVTQSLGTCGFSASIGSTGFGGATPITGLAGMTSGMVGASLTLSGCANPANNGTFPIASYVSSTSVLIFNTSIVTPDANSGEIVWCVDNQTFDFDVEVYGSTSAAPSYAFNGYWNMVINHYRPAAVIIGASL